MKYDSEVFATQYPIVASFVQHLAYYRACVSVYNRSQLKSPFWCATVLSHAKVASLEWCKVFGSDGRNDTHWKNLVSENKETTYDSFRNILLDKLKLSRPEWDAYHKKMLDFRNKYVAHIETNENPPTFPILDEALEIAYAYDDWIRDLISPDFYEGPRLKQVFDDWYKSTEVIAEKAMKASAGVKEPS